MQRVIVLIISLENLLPVRWSFAFVSVRISRDLGGNLHCNSFFFFVLWQNGQVWITIEGVYCVGSINTQINSAATFEVGYFSQSLVYIIQIVCQSVVTCCSLAKDCSWAYGWVVFQVFLHLTWKSAHVHMHASTWNHPVVNILQSYQPLSWSSGHIQHFKQQRMLLKAAMLVACWAWPD